MTHSEDTLARIAWQYYIEDLTQQEIAERFNLSRPKVARLLKEAREKGIVEFHIKGMAVEHLEVEQELRQSFGLKDAVVITSLNDVEENRRELGRAAAKFLEGHFKPDLIVGLGMGRTLAEIPPFIGTCPEPSCTFAEMVGGASRTDAGLDTYNISWRLADQCGGVATHVNSPVVVQSQEMRDMLLEDPQILSALDTAADSHLALVGVGRVSENMTLARQGYCDEDNVRDLIEKGAVCDIIGHYFDLQGRLVPNCIEDRLVGLTLEQIARIPTVIGVAGGVHKAGAILGALRSGYLHVLITDSQAAETVQHTAGN